MTQLSVDLVQAEHMSGISRHTWRKMAKDDRVRAARVGKKIFIPVSEIERVTAPGAKTKSRTEV